MILLRSRIFASVHFTKPTLSILSSLPQLEAAIQQKTIQSIIKKNNSLLRPFSFKQQIVSSLALTPEQIPQICQRSINISLINSKNLQHRITNILINQNPYHLNLNVNQFGLPFSSNTPYLSHFSQKRGIPTFPQLKQYSINQNTLMIFNLPDNFSAKDISFIVNQQKIKTKVHNCILGLPAYAIVKFQNAASAQKTYKQMIQNPINIQDRLLFVKNHEQIQKLRLGNRRMVIKIQEDDRFQQTIINLSRHGRVLHIDYPLQVFISPSVQDVKKHYVNSKQLIRINIKNQDGSNQYQYYPTLQMVKQRQNINQLSSIQKADRLYQNYQKRTRFAKQINVVASQTGKLKIKNKGYFVVTYSTYEQCQNLYFSYSYQNRMQLVGQRQQFEYDNEFRKMLLRQIDNEYLERRKEEHEQKIKIKQGHIMPNDIKYMQVQNEDLSYFILQRMFNTKKADQMRQNMKQSDHTNQQNTFLLWQKYLKVMKQQKKNSKSMTFDQLAQLQLYGRVLPKDEQIQKLKIDSQNYKITKQFQIIRNNYIIQDPTEVYIRDKIYTRIRQHNNRHADELNGIVHGSTSLQQSAQNSETKEAIQETNQSSQQNIGKQGFSTIKAIPLYRKRNNQQLGRYLSRYFNFFRKTIYQYMGVFDDKNIQKSLKNTATFLNPRSLTFINGQNFLAQENIINALQFRRDVKQAQFDYQSYILNHEYLKSNNVNANQLNAEYPQAFDQVIEEYSNVGIVEYVRKIQGDMLSLQRKAKILNATVASFGEQYKIQESDNERFLIKLRKLQNLVSIERISALQQFVMQNTMSVTPQQSLLFQKHYHSLKKQGKVPKQLADVFGVRQGTTIQQLLINSQKVTKKDLQICQRYRTLPKQQIYRDLKAQQKLQLVRQQKSKINSDDFVKDPSQIYVRDRQGYYRVSRYRQI